MKRESRFDVDYIRARDPNFVGGDQYNYNNYVKQIIQQRESFAQKVAATKTKARLLFWSGFLMVAGGGTAFMLPILKAMKDGSSVDPSQNPFDAGLHIGGYPIGIIGFALGFVGQFILVAGIILHIVAASRRKTLMNLPPLPPPPQRFPGE